MNGLRKQRLFIGVILLISMALYLMGQDWALWLVYLLIILLFLAGFFNFCPSDAWFHPLGKEKK
jgi:hypothetical protein